VPKKDWLIVFGHHPVFSGNQVDEQHEFQGTSASPSPSFVHHLSPLSVAHIAPWYGNDVAGGHRELQTTIKPLLEQHEAVAYISGYANHTLISFHLSHQHLSDVRALT
jgi:hypothetical protein